MQYSRLVILMLLLSATLPVMAAFPAHTQQSPALLHSPPLLTDRNNKTIDEDAVGVYGIISLGCALAAPVLLVLALFNPYSLIAGLIAVVFAIVFGLLGINRQNHRFAFTGFMLGVLDATLLLIAYMIYAIPD